MLLIPHFRQVLIAHQAEKLLPVFHASHKVLPARKACKKQSLPESCYSITLPQNNRLQSRIININNAS